MIKIYLLMLILSFVPIRLTSESISNSSVEPSEDVEKSNYCDKEENNGFVSGEESNSCGEKISDVHDYEKIIDEKEEPEELWECSDATLNLRKCTPRTKVPEFQNPQPSTVSIPDKHPFGFNEVVDSFIKGSLNEWLKTLINITKNVNIPKNVD